MSTWAQPSKEPIMERLIVIALESTHGRFSGRLESTGEVIVASSKQPLVDGARETACTRLDPGTPLTMRHQGSAHDTSNPCRSAGGPGGLTRREKESTLRAALWMPFSRRGGYPKVGLRACGCTRGHPRAEPSVRSDIPGSRLTSAATTRPRSALVRNRPFGMLHASATCSARFSRKM